MPEEKELGPAAVTYKDVLKGHGNDGSGAGEAWRKIGEVTGAGHSYPGELASIDLTNATQAVRDKVAKLSVAEVKEEAKVATPVSGTAPSTTPGVAGPGTNAPQGGNS